MLQHLETWSPMHGSGAQTELMRALPLSLLSTCPATLGSAMYSLGLGHASGMLRPLRAHSQLAGRSLFKSSWPVLALRVSCVAG